MGVGNLNVEHKSTIYCCCIMYIHGSCKCDKGFQSGKGEQPSTTWEKWKRVATRMHPNNETENLEHWEKGRLPQHMAI